jgi:hypothetical protein
VSWSTPTSSSRRCCSRTRHQRPLALVLDEHRLVLTDWIIDELHEVVGRKRPDLLAALDAFLDGIDYELASPGDPSVPISDPDDQPILDAAVAGAADVIVTGDKALLSLVLDRPRILTARDFLDSSSNTGAPPTDNFDEPRP